LYSLLSGTLDKPLTFSEKELNPTSDPTVLGKTVDTVNGLCDIIASYWKLEKIRGGNLNAF
jgi:hypothetical protein